MPRRSKLDLETIRAVGNVECPLCHELLTPADYLRIDYEHLRCAKCGEDFLPQAKGSPAMHKLRHLDDCLSPVVQSGASCSIVYLCLFSVAKSSLKPSL